METPISKTAPWITVGIVLSVMAFLGLYQFQSGERSAQIRFQNSVAQAESIIQSRLQSDQTILRGASEFMATQHVGPATWRRYVRELKLDEKCPTLYGLGYAAYVLEEGRDSSERIIPRGKRFDYMVVEQIEPRDQNNGLIGFDLGSELAARTAAEHARDTQSAVLSGKLILPDDPQHRAFVFFYPVLQKGVFQGWVFGRFREEDLLKGLFAGQTHTLTLQVYEGPAMTRDALFFDSDAPLSAWQKPYEGPLTAVKGFQAAGRTWTLNFMSRERPEGISKPQGSNGMFLILILAVCVLALVIALLWVWMRQRAGVLAQEMLSDMHLRETALTLGPQGIIIADATESDFPVIYVNRAFEKITGYKTQEVLGKNCRFLEGTDRDQKGLQELRRALKDQRDCRVLLRNYRKDGTPFWNDLFVSPVRNDMGRIVQFVAIQQDVTEREQTTRRLATESAIIRALAESPSFYEASPRILKAICESQEWDLGTFWRLDHRANILQCVDQWHPADLELQDLENFLRDITFSREMGIPGHIWEKGEQVWISDLTKETRFPDASLAVQAGLVSACGFPIANKRGLQGVLVFYSRRIWPLSKNLLLLMVGTGAQISHYMEREKVQIEQKELTILERGLAEFMGEGLIAVDRDGYCIYVNAMAGRMLGYHPRTLLGQNVHEVVHPVASKAACEPGSCPILSSLQSTRAAYIDLPGAVFRRKDHDPLPVAYTTSPIIDRDLIQGVVITFVDATARRAYEQELSSALKEKEDEIARIQQMVSQTHASKNEPNPSEELLEKIKKLLG